MRRRGSFYLDDDVDLNGAERGREVEGIQFSHENEKGNATKNFYKTQKRER